MKSQPNPVAQVCDVPSVLRRSQIESLESSGGTLQFRLTMTSSLRSTVFLIIVVCYPTLALAQKSLAVFDEFADLFQQNYAFFDLRGVDWEQQKKIYRPKLAASTSNDELFATLCQMVDPLNDGHVFVSTGSKSCGSGKRLAWEAKAAAIEDFIQKKYLKSKAKHSGPVTYGMIDGSTGYIDIHHMEGCKSFLGYARRTAKEMDEALVAMKGAVKIIIDVRFNGGGNDECALGFAERFTDKKRMAYSKETYSKGSYGSHLDLYISPADKTNTTAKVVVLTSRATASAAEMFVMAMMALPQVTILGEPTRGIHSDIYLKKLSNGWQLGLSNQKYILPNGKVYEKDGLPPHNFMSFKGDVLEQGRDDLLEHAIGLSR